jgi:hypothetical protein
MRRQAELNVPLKIQYYRDGQEREACTLVRKRITQVARLQELEFFCKEKNSAVVESNALHSIYIYKTPTTIFNSVLTYHLHNQCRLY